MYLMMKGNQIKPLNTKSMNEMLFKRLNRWKQLFFVNIFVYALGDLGGRSRSQNLSLPYSYQP